MNKRITEAFAKSKAFIPFITCGDPSLEVTKQLVFAMAEAGADIIELGIPFSDPTAEGPVIQGANLRALSGGVTTDKIFAMVEEIRKTCQIPLVFMHKYQRDLTCFTDLFHHGKYLIGSYSTGECPQIGPLDHRSLCCGIRKRYAQLYNVRTGLGHGKYQLLRHLQRGISAGNKRDKCLAFCKGFCNSLIHGYPPLCNGRWLRSLCLRGPKS